MHGASLAALSQVSFNFEPEETTINGTYLKNPENLDEED